MLTKVKDNIFKSFMNLTNALLSGSLELFPKEAVERVIEQLSWFLHNKAIRIEVSQDKPAKKSIKRLQFSQSSRQPQSSKCSALQSTGKSSGRIVVSFALHLALRLPPPPDAGGRSSESFLPPLQLQVGGVLGRHWISWHSCGSRIQL